jgi:hypothetical protein
MTKGIGEEQKSPQEARRSDHPGRAADLLVPRVGAEGFSTLEAVETATQAPLFQVKCRTSRSLTKAPGDITPESELWTGPSREESVPGHYKPAT